MRLSLRLLALFVLGIFVLLTIDSAYLVNREMRLFDQSAKRSSLQLGLTYARLLERIAREVDVQEALTLVQGLNRDQYGVKVRWTWLDAVDPDAYAPHLAPGDLEALRSGREVSRSDVGIDGDRIRITHVPVSLGHGRPGALELTESMAFVSDQRHEIITRAVVFGGLAVLLGLLMSVTILRPLIGRPLDTLVHKTQTIAAGDFSSDLDIHGRGELSDLAEAMNRMCAQLSEAHDLLVEESEAKLDALDQLRQAEKLAVLGRISSGLAHELGTPLNVVSGRASMIASGTLTDAEVEESTRIIQEQSERMTGIIRQFLDYARRPHGHPQPERVEELVEGTIRLLEPTARAANVELLREIARDIPAVPLDRNQMQQVIMNLVVNAIHSMPDGGRVRLSVLTADLDQGPGVRVVVADEGVGIPADKLEQIFEPFFTTKETGKGTGLGLSIAKGIVEEHGGRITVESTPNQGSTFTIDLPGSSLT